MIFFLYNILLVLALPFLTPVFLAACLMPKYRGRIFCRCGGGLAETVAALDRLRQSRRPTVWVHALSVGELLSAEPLLRELRLQEPQIIIVISASTRSGEMLARKKFQDVVDIFLPYPLDLWPVVARFQQTIRPHLFILVETDLWPNFLLTARKNKIPCLFVNCRISAKSWRWFSRCRFVFLPVFLSFHRTYTQTGADARRLLALGVDRERVTAAGNLKYDAVVAPAAAGVAEKDAARSLLPAKIPVFVAGSTHAGEEKILFEIFSELAAADRLFLVIAPRNPGRAEHIRDMAKKAGIAAFLRSAGPLPDASLMILDSIGELARLYSAATIAFVGGSLVGHGGHNPLEAAAAGVPVLFGPHMDDFAEIAASLVNAGAAFQIKDKDGLLTRVRALLADPDICALTGSKGKMIAAEHRGAAALIAAEALELLRAHPPKRVRRP